MVNLLLAMHNHQPVGNFDGVFKEAYEKSYRPFLDVLERHPKIKVALHYTGSLLDWLEKNEPGFIARIKKLVKEGRVEIFGGGYYEPILTVIPHQDAEAQLNLLTEKVKKLFGYEAKGAWIAERVWEPKMPVLFSNCNLDYGIVDDSHFTMVGKKPEELSGFYETEDEGKRFNLFACCEQLRYVIPFGKPEKTIEYLKAREQDCPEVTIAYGDDGEKFGLWPGTYKWVYEEGWLEKFFTILEQNSSWLQTMTFKEYYDTHLPTDRVYLPCASYREMLEWSKGFYRNFMVKYPEVNLMHKRMLQVSHKIDTAKNLTKSETTKARKHLLMAQANDAYWHGVFGGLYHNHLRSAVYQNLIKAESLLDAATKRKPAVQLREVDVDYDGDKEIIIETKNNNFYLKPNAGATLFGWDVKDKTWNLVNTISRKEEIYHKKIREKNKSKEKEPQSKEGIATIHDNFVQKQDDLVNFLFYDKNPRHCLVDHFLSNDIEVAQFFNSSYEECGDFSTDRYEAAIKKHGSIDEIVMSCRGHINHYLSNLTKKISPTEHGLMVRYDIKNLESKEVIDATFGVEFNFSLYDKELAAMGQILQKDHLQVRDQWNSFVIDFKLSQKANVAHYSVETVSDSETGIEKTYQQLCVVLLWPLKINPNESWSVNFSMTA
ncbi:MAG: alpha-amylase/4-alpha-glucanotransferase domain-containing protein [Candidatus Omnitrophota bacterium]